MPVTLIEKTKFREGLDILAASVGDMEDVIALLEEYLRDRKGWLKPDRDNFKPSQVRKAWQRQGAICGNPKCRGAMVDPKRNNQTPDAEQTTGDHFIAANNGGKASDDNLVAVHRRCNSQKSDMNPIEWSKRTGRPISEMIHGTLVGDGVSNEIA